MYIMTTVNTAERNRFWRGRIVLCSKMLPHGRAKNLATLPGKMVPGLAAAGGGVGAVQQILLSLF
jgi:hypothetical protein